MKKKIIKLYCLLIAVCVMMGIFLEDVQAKTHENEEKKQIIFLLDASHSMSKDNNWEFATDSAALVAAYLPDNYEVAILAYNTVVSEIAGFNESDKDIKNIISNIELKGYTNPAVALETAINMFHEDALEKRVVFISDGEIAMPNEVQSKEAIESYNAAVNLALEKQIKIDMFILPDEGAENQILDGAEKTFGKSYIKTSSQGLEETAINYIFDELQMERIKLSASDNEEGSIPIDLKDTYAYEVRILLVTEQKIKDVHIVGQCEQIQVIEGNRFAVAQITNPMEAQIEVAYSQNGKGKAYAYLIKEYDLQTKVGKQYLSEDGNFTIEVEIRNHQDELVLNAENIKKAVRILIDGKESHFETENGVAILSYYTVESDSIEIQMNFENLQGLVKSNDTKNNVRLEVPVMEEVVEENIDYRPLWIVVAGLTIVLIAITIIYEYQKLKKNLVKEPKEINKKVNPFVEYDYSGQITVYFLKGDEEDVPPCSIKLFGRNKKSFSFDWIRSQCNIQLDLQDADNIRFCGGKDHTLCFTNLGNATIIKGGKVLTNNKKYYLGYGEKILVVFNNGAIELELHYKNIKPSER